MLIPVIFNDHTESAVPADVLERLITERRIMAFRRAAGMVRVGHDQLRTSGKQFNGPDRRSR